MKGTCCFKSQKKSTDCKQMGLTRCEGKVPAQILRGMYLLVIVHQLRCVRAIEVSEHARFRVRVERCGRSGGGPITYL